MAKDVTLGVEPAIWNYQRVHLPSRAESPHNFHPVGFDNCSEPILLDIPTIPLEYGSFIILLQLYHLQGISLGTETSWKIPCFLFNRLFQIEELQQNLITRTGITQKSWTLSWV